MGAVLAVVLLSLSVGLTVSSAPGSDSGVRSLVSTTACPGAMLAHNYSGTVAADGVPYGPSVAVTFSFEVTTVYTVAYLPWGVSCSTQNETVLTHPGGSFNISIYPTTSTVCAPSGSLGGLCTNTSGPFLEVNAALSSPTPPGYFSSLNQNGTNVQVEFYSYLATVGLDPSGPSATFSTEEHDAVRATPMTGTGSPSPGLPQFDWTLTGVGWTFDASPDGSAVNVTAAFGAGVGNLTVVASLAVDGGLDVAAPASVELVAVATTISSASLNRTSLDVGQSLRAEVNGTGVTGFVYSATVDPGLGEPASTVPCASTPEVEGTASLTCTAMVNYSSAGVAQPVVAVSNGLSSAEWQFPDVTVNPRPSVVFLPAGPVGYANATVSVAVQAAAGTGVAPYAEGCLASGNGSVQCIDSPGPTWAFDSVYRDPGSYTALAWTVDATGLNRSATTTVRIVAPLGVAILGNSNTGAAGTPIDLSAVVSGGDLPAHVWWNATDASNPVVSEWVTSDGPVQATFVPSAAGFVTVSVAVVDDLDTAVDASAAWSIGLGAAASVVPVVLPPASSARAGSPVPMTWQAIDAAGEVVHDFSSVAEIELGIVGSTATALGWVNASGIGPLPSRLPGWFDVPSSAWIGGALNVSLTSRDSGTIRIDLVLATGFPVGGNAPDVTVLPDVDHLRLSEPRTAFADDRANDTLWQVTDRFGNPADGASVAITTSFDGNLVRTLVPVEEGSNGATFVWTNYSAPDGSAGTVTVTDLAGDVLLPPVSVPGVAGPWAVLPVGVLAGAMLVATAAGAATYYRRRTPRPTGTDARDDDETALQRLAEGRATVVEVVRRTGPLDLAGLSTAWRPPPVPPDLADWVASLLTDGTLDATFGADGVARFCLPVDDGTGTQVMVDLDAFDRAQVRRDAATAEWDSDDA